MFREATSLSNVNALSNWDISNVTDLSNMFYGATSLSDVSGLANWNTGSVTNMSYMFYGTTNLTGASSLHWVTKSVAKNSYVQIFYNSGVLTSGNYPTFYSDDAKTQVIGGTWNSSGTFKPSS